MWLLLGRWAPACRSKDFTLWTDAREVAGGPRWASRRPVPPPPSVYLALQLPLSDAGAAPVQGHRW